MVQIELPYHLQRLAQVDASIEISVNGPVTLNSVITALELDYPVLRGTIRDYATGQRRPYLRYFACERDISLQSPDDELPAPVVTGDQPLIIFGAVAGG